MKGRWKGSTRAEAWRLASRRRWRGSKKVLDGPIAEVLNFLKQPMGNPGLDGILRKPPDRPGKREECAAGPNAAGGAPGGWPFMPAALPIRANSGHRTEAALIAMR